jgi:nitrate reductase NapE component
MGVSLELAIAAVRAGRREEGRQLLNLLIQQNPNNDKAWLWMSSVVDTDEQRARCLYHVLAIDPTNQLARRGLQVLGIIVSDSRPVKIPRDSQPIAIPKPTQNSQPVPRLGPELQLPPGQPVPALDNSEKSTADPQPTPSEPRRPFLIDPQAITKALPFMPLQPSLAEPIQASPAILSIDVDAYVDESRPVQASANPAKTQKMTSDAPVSSPFEPAPASENNQAQDSSSKPPADRLTDTQKLAESSVKSKHPSAFGPDHLNQPAGSQQQSDSPDQIDPQQPSAGPPFSAGRQETRPSQPIPVTYPNMAMMPAGQMPYYPTLPPHANVTQSMPAAQPAPPPYSGQGVYSGHANATMGMPLQNQFGPSPQLIEPALHSSPMPGMMPYSQGYFTPPPPQAMALHSNATMMMPMMTEAEARARLNAVQAIPTANATAMALQNGSNWLGVSSGQMPQSLYPTPNEEEEEGEELNVLAVIIFGTLSVTALGGFGMLILLMLTTPMS